MSIGSYLHEVWAVVFGEMWVWRSKTVNLVALFGLSDLSWLQCSNEKHISTSLVLEQSKFENWEKSTKCSSAVFSMSRFQRISLSFGFAIWTPFCRKETVYWAIGGKNEDGSFWMNVSLKTEEVKTNVIFWLVRPIKNPKHQSAYAFSVLKTVIQLNNYSLSPRLQKGTAGFGQKIVWRSKMIKKLSLYGTLTPSRFRFYYRNLKF